MHLQAAKHQLHGIMAENPDNACEISSAAVTAPPVCPWEDVGSQETVPGTRSEVEELFSGGGLASGGPEMEPTPPWEDADVSPTEADGLSPPFKGVMDVELENSPKSIMEDPYCTMVVSDDELDAFLIIAVVFLKCSMLTLYIDPQL